jgi:hypothetical protein
MGFAGDVKDKFGDATNKVGNTFKSATNKVENTFKSATNKVENTFKSATNKVGRTFNDTTNKVGRTFNNTTKKVGRALDGAVDKTGRALRVQNVDFWREKSRKADQTFVRGMLYAGIGFVVTGLICGIAGAAVAVLYKGSTTFVIPFAIATLIFFFTGASLLWQYMTQRRTTSQKPAGDRAAPPAICPAFFTLNESGRCENTYGLTESTNGAPLAAVCSARVSAREQNVTSSYPV